MNRKPIRFGPSDERLVVNTSSRPARALLVTAALSTLLMSAACGSSDDAASADTAAPKANGPSVSTALLAFDPETVTVSKGQTVTWVGGDNITHVLVEGTYQVGSDKLRTEQTDDKAFSLRLSKKGQQVSHTYDKAGTFTYYCTIHHGMNGTVVVS
jgi:plastocyanin